MEHVGGKRKLMGQEALAAHSVIWSIVLINVRNKKKVCRLKPEITVGAIRTPDGSIFILPTSLAVSSEQR